MTTEVRIINRDGIAEIVFRKNRKVISWSYLTRDEQINILSSISSNYRLFEKFLKKD